MRRPSGEAAICQGVSICLFRLKCGRYSLVLIFFAKGRSALAFERGEPRSAWIVGPGYPSRGPCFLWAGGRASSRHFHGCPPDRGSELCLAGGHSSRSGAPPLRSFTDSFRPQPALRLLARCVESTRPWLSHLHPGPGGQLGVLGTMCWQQVRGLQDGGVCDRSRLLRMKEGLGRLSSTPGRAPGRSQPWASPHTWAGPPHAWRAAGHALREDSRPVSRRP